MNTTLDMLPNVYIKVRHAPDCRDRAKDGGSEWGDYKRCHCRKWLHYYDACEDPEVREQRSRLLSDILPDYPRVGGTARWSAKSRTWAEAERQVHVLRDKFDPIKQEVAAKERQLKALQAEKESQSATIEKAVAMFLVYKQSNPHRHSSRLSGQTAHSTMKSYRNLLGNVDPKTLEMKCKGRLFTWLEKQNPRPVLISDLTPTVVDAFRASWDLNDSTALNAFTRLNSFFEYCRKRGEWIKKNPLDGVARPSVEEGSRTTAFSDEQYKNILDTIAKREADIKAAGTPRTKLETEKQLADNKRVLALIELMRWGGLAIVDAVDFNLSTLNGDELRYRRHKTNKLAKPVLPAHVTDLLLTVVPINGDRNHPFRDTSVRLESDKAYWRRHLKELFVDAGIRTVETEIRQRDAHAHMLRDTFAVGQLERHYRDGKPSLKSIADALGDSIPVMLKHYAPVIDKLERAHSEEQRKVVAAQVAEMNKHEEVEVLVMGKGARK